MKTLVVALSLSLASTVTLAATDQNAPPVTQYEYGVHLDIARVVQMTDLTTFCGVGPARMTYEDSQMQTKTVEYLVWGTGCKNDY
ncbi:DUF2790 domain-containing protein [Pseudomonas sp. JM0905a]|uniref:DUF2790 domain-containing protein n=1 Tax=Metapseudomonas resinovorans TaxID=53412 RepID=A0ABT4Y9H9_METRE|nr:MULTISPECIES: DUF2790 domain-containing protein [Pseudomonas]MBD2840015.1 DUF2790 domain-containing protein [Pseudomonas sp. JM0905a]MDA8485474.1 DUF2790 domain-containing protein [Pseudomonas resinovorans]MDH4869737.1 DUF2790 domain-containing protein [Pseudomonas sp. BN515]